MNTVTRFRAAPNLVKSGNHGIDPYHLAVLQVAPDRFRVSKVIGETCSWTVVGEGA